MHHFTVHVCTICGREKTRSGWFLLAENRWEDKLKILKWKDTLVWTKGVHAVCCAEHALELVVHWIRTDTLNYPLARTQLLSRDPLCACKNDPDTSGAQQLGELYVHRESLGRLLLDKNPNALTVILDELVFALRAEEETEETTLAGKVFTGTGQPTIDY